MRSFTILALLGLLAAPCISGRFLLQDAETPVEYTHTVYDVDCSGGCPATPAAAASICAFYFEGFENAIPTFYLGPQETDGQGVQVDDHAISTTVIAMDDMGNPAPLEIDATNAYTCDLEAGSYLNPTGPSSQFKGWNVKSASQGYEQGVIAVQAFNAEFAPRASYCDKCVKVTITDSRLAGAKAINLNYNDGRTEVPQSQRCVIFRTTCDEALGQGLELIPVQQAADTPAESS